MADTLIDAGPLIALMNRKDQYHSIVKPLFQQLNSPFITTEAAVAEAMYNLGKWAGWPFQKKLLRAILDTQIVTEPLGASDYPRIYDLMDKYADNPMDFADASLVAVAERLRLTKIFTVDRADFSTYRLNGRTPFSILGP